MSYPVYNNSQQGYPAYNQQFYSNNNNQGWYPQCPPQQTHTGNFNGQFPNYNNNQHSQNESWHNNQKQFNKEPNQYNQHQNYNQRNNANNKQVFRCEPCERDFNSENAIMAHNKQHVKCESPGCEYTASSKAVKLHYIQNHEKGRFRIVLTTPEEIEKWRAERRRNWPSKSNIERKSEKRVQNTADGIVLETKEFVYQGRPGATTSRKRGNQEKSIKEKDIKKPKVDVNNATGRGLSLLQSYDVDSSSDVETEVNNVDMKKEVSQVHGENPQTVDTTAVIETPEKPDEKEDGEIEDSELDEVNKEELPERFKDKLSDKRESKHRRTQKHKKRGDNNNKKQLLSKTDPAKKVSLLEMLLAKEIRHERNVILQCVRYIVQNSYFQ